MKKRIFIAVDIPPEAKRRVSEYIDALRNDFSNLRVGWEKAEKLHITLKFLGDVEPEDLSGLIEAVEKKAGKLSKFTVKIERTGVFPNERKARILWLGFGDETDGLQKIYDLLETVCEKTGFKTEKRAFKPHLTIARLRAPDKSADLAKKHLEKEFEPAGFEVCEIVIYESKLQPSGSFYIPVERISI